MDARLRIAVAVLVVAAAITVAAALLAAHGIVLTPLDEVGGTPH